jgi:hypothetical protein
VQPCVVSDIPNFCRELVAALAEGRTGYREWARRSGTPEDIYSIDDRYHHDIDRLVAWPHVCEGGRSWRWAVALPGGHTTSKNPAPFSQQ